MTQETVYLQLSTRNVYFFLLPKIQRYQNLTPYKLCNNFNESYQELWSYLADFEIDFKKGWRWWLDRKEQDGLKELKEKWEAEVNPVTGNSLS